MERAQSVAKQHIKFVNDGLQSSRAGRLQRPVPSRRRKNVLRPPKATTDEAASHGGRDKVATEAALAGAQGRATKEGAGWARKQQSLHERSVSNERAREELRELTALADEEDEHAARSLHAEAQQLGSGLKYAVGGRYISPTRLASEREDNKPKGTGAGAGPAIVRPLPRRPVLPMSSSPLTDGERHDSLHDSWTGGPAQVDLEMESLALRERRGTNEDRNVTPVEGHTYSHSTSAVHSTISSSSSIVREQRPEVKDLRPQQVGFMPWTAFAFKVPTSHRARVDGSINETSDSMRELDA